MMAQTLSNESRQDLCIFEPGPNLDAFTDAQLDERQRRINAEAWGVAWVPMIWIPGDAK